MLTPKIIVVFILLTLCGYAENNPESLVPSTQIAIGKVEAAADGLHVKREGQAELVFALDKNLTAEKLSGFLRAAKDQELECVIVGGVVSDVRLPQDGHISFRCQHCACRMQLKAASQWDETCKSCECGKSNGSCYGEYR